MKVIGISGLPGSGKSLIFDIAHEKGAVVIKMGDVVREEAKKRNESSGTTAKALRQEHGQYVVAKLTIRKIKEMIGELKESNIKNILVEGIRSPYEVEMFKNSFKDFTLISLFANPKTRFERVIIRKRDDDTTNYEGFKERDERELAFGIGNVIATSDYLIVNDSDFESYETRAKEILNEEMI